MPPRVCDADRARNSTLCFVGRLRGRLRLAVDALPPLTAGLPYGDDNLARPAHALPWRLAGCRARKNRARGRVWRGPLHRDPSERRCPCHCGGSLLSRRSEPRQLLARERLLRLPGRHSRASGRSPLVRCRHVPRRRPTHAATRNDDRCAGQLPQASRPARYRSLLARLPRYGASPSASGDAAAIAAGSGPAHCVRRYPGAASGASGALAPPPRVWEAAALSRSCVAGCRLLRGVPGARARPGCSSPTRYGTPASTASGHTCSCMPMS